MRLSAALGDYPLLLSSSWMVFGYSSMRSWEALGSSLDILQGCLSALGGTLSASWELLKAPGELLGAPRKLLGALGNSWGALGWSLGGDHEQQEKSQAEKRPNTLRIKAETRFRKTRKGEKPGVIDDFGGAPGRQCATVAIISFWGPEGHRRRYLAPTGCPWGLPAAP